MRAHLDTLKQLTEAEGRDFSALTISYKAPNRPLAALEKPRHLKS
jgi:hypothetical protein